MQQFLSYLLFSSTLFFYDDCNNVGIKSLQLGLNFI